jgi:catechol 2,3-dioxygenase-like lactoylglutathione lyase family enzyme
MKVAPVSLGVTRLGQVCINVHDVGRATAFYRDKLGLPFLFAAGQLAFFDCAGVRLMLSPPEKPEFDHPSSVLYLVVPDIKTAPPPDARCRCPL